MDSRRSSPALEGRANGREGARREIGRVGKILGENVGATKESPDVDREELGGHPLGLLGLSRLKRMVAWLHRLETT